MPTATKTETKTETTYEQLETLCLPHIERYYDDLIKHDREWIDANPGVPFLHFTRESGTHIITFPAADSEAYPHAGVRVPYLFGTADRDYILRATSADLEVIDGEMNFSTVLRLHFDGTTLRKITHDKAKLIVTDYIRRIRREWQRTENN